jgi:hypothetical protein
MYCRKCGTPNPDDRSSCLQCNAPLTSSLPQKPGSGPVSSGPMQTQTTPTSIFNEQPPTPTVIIPSQQSTGRQTPTTGPIMNSPPPPYQPSYQQQQPPSYQPQQSQPFQPQQMQQSAPAQMNYGAPPDGQAKTNVVAIISLVSGILGILSCWGCGFGFLPSIAGGVMGFLAMKKVQVTGERGRELAIAGLITGIVGFALSLFWVLYYGLAGIGAIMGNH